MKHAISSKVISCAVGATMVVGAGGASAAAFVAHNKAEVNPQVAFANDDWAPVEVIERAAVDYDKIANVGGSFCFSQDVLTPADDVFNLFGTAATVVCAKPGYAFNSVDHEAFYVNVGGDVEKTYTIGLDEIEEMDATMQDMRCTCGMSPAIAMASVKGVKVSDIIEMAGVSEKANTITFKDKDGYGMPMPLSYVTDKDALLVYEIGGKQLSNGERLQVWIPDTVAKYFTRAVTDIELSYSETLPEVDGPNADARAKVSIMNNVRDVFSVGDLLSFEGYADDCGKQVVAVEFSLDNGETWTSFDTTQSNTEDWVYWHFDYVAEKAGTFKLDVRAVTEDGTVSPLASSVVFQVNE